MNNSTIANETTTEAKKPLQIQIRRLKKLETTAARNNDR
jgi:hypothetical protein